jgi:hypothetical protein
MPTRLHERRALAHLALTADHGQSSRPFCCCFAAKVSNFATRTGGLTLKCTLGTPSRGSRHLHYLSRFHASRVGSRGGCLAADGTLVSVYRSFCCPQSRRCACSNRWACMGCMSRPSHSPTRVRCRRKLLFDTPLYYLPSRLSAFLTADHYSLQSHSL